MTIVAYDSGVNFILADTYYTFSNGREGFFKSKTSVDEAIGKFALAGDVFHPLALTSAYTKWTQDGCPVPFARECEGFLRLIDGTVLYVCSNGKTISFTDVDSFGPYVACGSGAAWYYAFRADGAGHIEAFQKVCLLHAECGYDDFYSKF